jgi:hypothetical protein
MSYTVHINCALSFLFFYFNKTQKYNYFFDFQVKSYFCKKYFSKTENLQNSTKADEIIHTGFILQNYFFQSLVYFQILLTFAVLISIKNQNLFCMKNFISFGVKIVIFSFFSALFCPALAIGERTSTNAHSFALGDLHALDQSFINPASLSFQSDKQLRLSVLNRFEMKELNTSNLFGIFPNEWVDAGVLFSHYGYKDYQIIQVQTGFSKKIFSGLSLGINLIYSHESSILEENPNHRLSADMGIRYQYSPTVEWAFLAENGIHTGKESCWNLYGGMSYKAVDNCRLFIESGYGATQKLSFSLGIDYELVEQLNVRAGIQTANQTPSFGIAYRWNKWQINTGFSLHPTLGISSIIELIYNF